MIRWILAPMLVVASFASAATAAAATYALAPQGSSLTFEFVQADAKTTGAFRDYEVDLTLDEKNPAAGKLLVRVKVGSLDTQDAERDEVLRSAELFDAQKHPVATFTSTRIVRTRSGYQAIGKLTIKDVTRDFTVPFTLKSGRMTGAATLRRLDFGVGKGEWESTEWVGNDVNVGFDLRLAARPAK